ncbi:MAG: hypothetical protein ABJH98_07915 [Reichenbachiella sp.]|uniref:hypothetical protein n=1 Tax=Reichenbachiella sp. TaxID=2184521 RepID=UPI003297CFF7
MKKFCFVLLFLWLGSEAIIAQNCQPLTSKDDLTFGSVPTEFDPLIDFSTIHNYPNISGFLHGFVEDDTDDTKIYPTEALIEPLNIRYFRSARLCGYPTVRAAGDNPVFIPILSGWWADLQKVTNNKQDVIDKCNDISDYGSLYSAVQNLTWPEHPSVGNNDLYYEQHFKDYIDLRLADIDAMGIDESDVIIDIWNEPNDVDSTGAYIYGNFSEVFIDLAQYVKGIDENYRIAGPSTKASKETTDENGIKTIDIDFIEQFLDDLVAHNETASAHDKIELDVLSYHNFPHRGAVDQHTNDLNEVSDLLADTQKDYINKLGIKALYIGEHLGDRFYQTDNQTDPQLMNKRQYDDLYILSSYHYIEQKLRSMKNEFGLDGMAGKSTWKVYDSNNPGRNPAYGAIGAFLNHDFSQDNLEDGKGWGQGTNGDINSNYISHKLFSEMTTRFKTKYMDEDNVLIMAGKKDNDMVRLLVFQNSNGVVKKEPYDNTDQPVTIKLTNLAKEFGASNELQLVSFSYKTHKTAVLDKDDVGDLDDNHTWLSSVKQSSNIDIEYFIIDTGLTAGTALYTTNLDKMEFTVEPRRVYCIEIKKVTNP